MADKTPSTIKSVLNWRNETCNYASEGTEIKRTRARRKIVSFTNVVHPLYKRKKIQTEYKQTIEKQTTVWRHYESQELNTRSHNTPSTRIDRHTQRLLTYRRSTYDNPHKYDPYEYDIINEHRQESLPKILKWTYSPTQIKEDKSPYSPNI